PDAVERELPTDVVEARRIAASDPRRHEVRIAAAAMRDGARFSLLRLRQHDDDDALLAGPDLVAGLAELLMASLSD
ncbi:MAG TPA: hypothetical protein VMT27_02450, partial [Actinomycetes bacterium]|nr:hypothetical protein [Actinomycetes bacterium]